MTKNKKYAKSIQPHLTGGKIKPPMWDHRVSCCAWHHRGFCWADCLRAYAHSFKAHEMPTKAQRKYDRFIMECPGKAKN